MFQWWGEDFGWWGRVGFITPPHFSITSTEFMGIVPYATWYAAMITDIALLEEEV